MLAYSAYKGYKDHKDKKSHEKLAAAHDAQAPQQQQQQQYTSHQQPQHGAPVYTHQVAPSDYEYAEQRQQHNQGSPSDYASTHSSSAQPSLEARWQNLEARVSALEARDAMR